MLAPSQTKTVRVAYIKPIVGIIECRSGEKVGAASQISAVAYSTAVTDFENVHSPEYL